MTQASLLRQRRFWPFFTVSFLGAFNDNLFKQVLVLMVAAGMVSVAGVSSDLLVTLSTALIMVPFVLFSALAGLVSDRFAKSRVVGWVKILEIPIMLLGAAGLWFNSAPVLLTVLFLTGLQSTFFGPAKYSLLPEVLNDRELVGGNALIEMGTFLSILLGTILGGVLVATFGEQGPRVAAGGVVFVALLGYGAARLMPPTRAQAPELRVTVNPIPSFKTMTSEILRERSVYLSVLGISWFWAFGAAFLALLPTYGADVLMVSMGVVTWFTSLFSLGIGVGSLWVERLSSRGLELRLVPLGAFGMTLFALDLFLIGPVAMGTAEAPAELWPFLQTFTGIRVSVDLLMLAACGGLFTVPLYTLMQRGASDEARSQVIAGNNIVNALLMVMSAGLVAALQSSAVPVPTIFLVFAALNLLTIIIICRVMPEFVIHLVAWILGRLMYRIESEGDEHIPIDGPAVLAVNHPSFVDFWLVGCVCRRPMRFVMYHTYFNIWWLRWFFQAAGAIPIAPSHENKAILDQAFEAIDEALNDGEVICIFPEGSVSRDGRLSPFRPGIERILKRTPVPVVPMAIQGMWGSYFSRRWGGKAMTQPFKRVWSRVKVEVGAPIAGQDATAQGLAEIIAEMGGWEVPPPSGSEEARAWSIK